MSTSWQKVGYKHARQALSLQRRFASKWRTDQELGSSESLFRVRKCLDPPESCGDSDQF